MSLFMTLFIQVLLSAAGGASVVAALISHKRQTRDAGMIYPLVFCTYFNFWGINVSRCLLLAGGEIYAYDNDWYLFVMDVTVVCGVSAFCYYTHGASKKGTFACAVLLVVIAVQFTRFAIQYKNFNTAVYMTLMPKNILLVGIIVLIYYFGIQVWENGLKSCRPRVSEVTAAVLVSANFFLFPTFETLLTNADEFEFTFEQVWWRFVGFDVLLAVFILAIMLILPEKKRKTFCYIVWGFSLCAYLQGMLLNGELFLMEGKKAEWSDSLKIINTLIWCILAAALFGFCLCMKKSIEKIITGVSLALCAMQTVGCVSLIPSYLDEGKSYEETYRNYFSERGINEAARDENVIVFVLDTYDVDFLEQALEKEPNLLEPLQDFIYFPDNVSQFSRTFPSIPYMLTEEMHFYDEPLGDYVDKAFEKCEFWGNLRESDYSYYIYEEEENIIGSAVSEGAKNFVREGCVVDENISFSGCIQAMAKIGAYRLFPYAYKEYYTYTADDINDMIVERKILDVPSYEGEDAELYRQLKEKGLTLGNDDKAFRFIHTRGAHAPYTMNAEGERISEGECDPVEQYIGCMRFVCDYVTELKRLGVYNKATIIITADHGENFVLKELEQATNPILFIKPGGDFDSLAGGVSDIRASQNDLLPTIAAAMGLEYDKQWGINLLDTKGQDKMRVRYHYYAVVEKSIQDKAKVYKIIGNSRDFSNWEDTGKYREFGEFY